MFSHLERMRKKIPLSSKCRKFKVGGNKAKRQPEETCSEVRNLDEWKVSREGAL